MSGKKRPNMLPDAVSARRQMVREMSTAGFNVPQIATRTGLNRSRVQTIRKELGLSRMWPGPYPPELWEQAERLLDDGASYNEVSRTLGISDQTVINHFPGRGWTEADRIEYCRALGTYDPDYAYVRNAYGGPFGPGEAVTA